MSQGIYCGFSDADRAAAPETLIAFLEVADALPAVQAYKRRLRELLRLEPGQTVLDVGCGAGIEACRIAQAYPGTSVVGLDREAMIGLASRRAEKLGVSVRWLAGRAEAIPLPAATVDACFTERVLKYLPDPVAGVGEMVRVLKPGGRIACFELDYAATVLGGDPATVDAVGAVLNASVGEARMGRRLPGLLHAAGVREVTYELVALSPPWVVHEATVSEPVRQALRQGQLPDSAAAWLERQATAASQGLFTVAFVGVLAAGRLPSAAARVGEPHATNSAASLRRASASTVRLGREVQLGTHSSGESADPEIGQIKVVFPGGAILGDLPAASNHRAVLAKRPREALREVQRREVRLLAPELPDPVLQVHPIDAGDAARVEIVLQE